MKLSIVIPAYNESKRITPTLEDVVSTMRETSVEFEVIVVDDGSTDHTDAVVGSLRKSMPEIRLVRYAENRGKGYAVRQGMLLARGEMRALLDADGSIGPKELLRIAQAVEDGADIAIGSRYVEGASTQLAQPWYRRAWSRLANKAIQGILVKGINDTQCGAKVFTAEAAQLLFVHAKANGWAFDLEILGMASRLGLRIVEVGIKWDDDPRSRINPVRDLFRVIAETMQIRMRLGKQTKRALAAGQARVSLDKRTARAKRAVAAKKLARAQYTMINWG